MTTTDQSQTPRPGWRASWTTEWCEGVETEVNPVIRSLWNDVKTRCERGLKAGPACEWVNERPVLYRMLTCMGSCSPQFWYQSSLLPALFQCFRSNARHIEIAWFFFFFKQTEPSTFERCPGSVTWQDALFTLLMVWTEEESWCDPVVADRLMRQILSLTFINTLPPSEVFKQMKRGWIGCCMKISPWWRVGVMAWLTWSDKVRGAAAQTLNRLMFSFFTCLSSVTMEGKWLLEFRINVI